MIFQETKLKGAYIVDINRIEDERGFFARGWCKKEFSAEGLVDRIVQTNISFNKTKGTLRGMHYQRAPYEEVKLVRCVAGAIFDVIVDLRLESPTYKQWIGVELTSANHRMLYVPENFAHGFQTLEDDTEVTYHVSQFYTPEAEKGLRYNDPSIAIEWPLAVEILSPKDSSWADYTG